MLLRPPALKTGDTVYLLSTARKITFEEVQPAINLFESWGLNVKIGKTIGAEYRQFAGTDTLRAEDFQAALDDAEVRAVICARGGYGTVRMMDAIRYDSFLANPKWIVGFSDVTFLHTHITNTLGIQTLHAPMPFNFATATAESLEALRSELFGIKKEFEVPPHPLNRLGSAGGVLTGGNLSILYSITGTHSVFNTCGKLLFLEDLDEYLYHVDRMMMNLKRSGKLRDLAGVIVGSFTEMKDNKVPFGCTAEEIIAEHLSEYDYPVCFGFPAGHIPDNRALVMGRRYQLTVSASGAYLI
ncbi:MAG: LD-carboxypeptidase [Chitinophagales bacterium]|nr:LD-carboxypeptidase [Chitinophagales bacterium]MDW8418671.1 LD-carboxypeptidase [Chitinophagales bacterium]